MAIVHNLKVGSNSYTLGTVHYITGTGTTAGTWLGSDPSITAYYDGLTIAYKLNVAGASTTTLNINSLGAKTVYRGGTTKVTTQYGVDSVVMLVYTTTGSTGCWQVADYDSNTTYSGEKGITVSSGKIGHSNSVTAATAKGDDSKTLSFGGTFTVPSVTYDAQGHITAKGTTTMTMPANPNTHNSHKVISGTKADGSTNITSSSASSGDIT